MEEFRDRIRKWIRSSGIDRNFIASQCLVSKRTVDRWLSRGEVIPPVKMKILEDLMSENANVINENQPTQVLLEFTPEQYAVVKAEAERRGLSVEEWAREVLHALASVTVRVRM